LLAYPANSVRIELVPGNVSGVEQITDPRDSIITDGRKGYLYEE
jgi:hypothetical protein